MEPTWELLRTDPSGQRIFYSKVDDYNCKAYECLETVEAPEAEWGVRQAPITELPAHYIIHVDGWLRFGNDRITLDITEIVKGGENLDAGARKAIERLGLYETSLENSGTEPIRELRLVREAVREHMNEKGHNRCWMDDKRLYDKALPEGCQAEFKLPPKDEWDQNCRIHCNAYWNDRQPEECKEATSAKSLLMVQERDGGEGTPGG